MRAQDYCKPVREAREAQASARAGAPISLTIEGMGVLTAAMEAEGLVDRDERGHRINHVSNVRAFIDACPLPLLHAAHAADRGKEKAERVHATKTTEGAAMEQTAAARAALEAATAPAEREAAARLLQERQQQEEEQTAARVRAEAGLCEHGHERSRCKECDGGSICGHGRVRSICKECDGGSICGHGRDRSRCKECDGGSICEHGRRRSDCKKCGGSGICEHGRRRSTCKECGRGNKQCEHGRQPSKCKVPGCGAIGKKRNVAAAAAAPAVDEAAVDEAAEPPAKKRKLNCGACGQEGHARTNRDCPKFVAKPS